MTAETSTLAERLLAITAEMPSIKATGKSPFSKEPALSIGDVEDAVRPLLVKHKVLIHFETRNLIPPTDTRREWIAEITAYLGVDGVNLTVFWADSGGTPAAAYSFARKSYLKQLFHIADGDDTHEASTPREPHKAPAGAKECPFCKDMGYVNSRGGASVYFQPSKGPMAGQWQCNGRTDERNDEGVQGWANHPLPLKDGEEISDPSEISF